MNLHLGMNSKQSLGALGEKLARENLVKNGYQIIASNYRTPFGEIDIIAQDGQILAFIEVKTRSSRQFGLPEEAINKKKLERMSRCIELYLKSHPSSLDRRIDVLAIEFDSGNVVRVELIKNALL